jgi:hypothetical protein
VYRSLWLVLVSWMLAVGSGFYLGRSTAPVRVVAEAPLVVPGSREWEPYLRHAHPDFGIAPKFDKTIAELLEGDKAKHLSSCEKFALLIAYARYNTKEISRKDLEEFAEGIGAAATVRVTLEEATKAPATR